LPDIYRQAWTHHFRISDSPARLKAIDRSSTLHVACSPSLAGFVLHPAFLRRIHGEHSWRHLSDIPEATFFVTSTAKNVSRGRLDVNELTLLKRFAYLRNINVTLHNGLFRMAPNRSIHCHKVHFCEF
jgi:hypothetical protein